MALNRSAAVFAADACNRDPLALLRNARVLLVTPHPDDESLAAGGLVQHALRAGAQVRVLQVTDGDNNPWPQRVLERRIVIGRSGRRRWAERRRGEVRAAAGILGLSQHSLQPMSWPDMGVTRRLRADGAQAIDTFEQHIRAWSPSLVVMPALGDTHPDHGSAHVLTRLALARLRSPAVCLEYLIHGNQTHGAQALAFELDSAMQACKRDAVLAHASQVALSRRRLLARVGPREHFQRLPADAGGQHPDALPLPWAIAPWLSWRMHLTLAHCDGVHDWLLQRAPLRRSGAGHLELVLPHDVPSNSPLFVRLDLHIPSPWIFDRWGWRCLTPQPRQPTPTT